MEILSHVNNALSSGCHISDSLTAQCAKSTQATVLYLQSHCDKVANALEFVYRSTLNHENVYSICSDIGSNFPKVAQESITNELIQGCQDCMQARSIQIGASFLDSIVPNSLCILAIGTGIAAVGYAAYKLPTIVRKMSEMPKGELALALEGIH